MTNEVLEFCRKQKLFSENEKVLCCVSGGADSMSLLHFIYTYGKELGVGEVICCHLNHGLRGAESDGDEEYVREFCVERGIPFYSENAHLADIKIPSGIGMEAVGRNARYDLFERTAAKTGATLIATGHTMNDNAETVLFRMARGTGLKGAAGIPVKRNKYIRPLLCVTREQTEQYCMENGVAFREDSSNHTDEYARNRVRHHVLPALKSVNEATVQAICRFADNAGEADAYLASVAEGVLESARIGQKYETGKLKIQQGIIKEYMLMQLLEEQGVQWDSDTVKRCTEALNDEGRTQINDSLQFISKKKYTYFDSFPVTDTEEVNANIGTVRFSTGRAVEITESAWTGKVNRKLPNGLFISALDYDKVKGNMYIRHRRDGDTFRGERRKCSKSLKDIMNEKGLTNREKDSLILLCDSEGIVWLEGEGIAERVCPSENSKKILDIKIAED